MYHYCETISHLPFCWKLCQLNVCMWGIYICMNSFKQFFFKKREKVCQHEWKYSCIIKQWHPTSWFYLILPAMSFQQEHLIFSCMHTGSVYFKMALILFWNIKEPANLAIGSMLLYVQAVSNVLHWGCYMDFHQKITLQDSKDFIGVTLLGTVLAKQWKCLNVAV